VGLIETITNQRQREGIAAMNRVFLIASGIFLAALVNAAAQTATAPATGNPVFPTTVSSKYSTESPGRARMHTCRDQYEANKATNANGGLKWIQKGGGYYSECNKHLKG
jgi:hypothetical protein